MRKFTLLSILAFIFFSSTSAIPPKAKVPSDSNSSPQDNLLIDSNSIAKHTSATSLGKANVTTDQMKNMSVNLADLEKHFGLLKDTTTKKSPDFWDKSNQFAMAGPVQVLNQVDATDFEVIIETTDLTDINGMLNMFNTIFQDPDAVKEGKKANKPQDILSSCLEMLSKAMNDDSTETIVIPAIDLVSTITTDIDLFQDFARKGGIEQVTQLSASPHPEVQKKAKQILNKGEAHKRSSGKY